MLKNKKNLELVAMFRNVVIDSRPVESFGMYIDVLELSPKGISDSFLRITDTLIEFCLRNDFDHMDCTLVIDSVVVFGRYLPSMFKADLCGDKEAIIDKCNIALSKIIEQMSTDMIKYGPI